MKYFIQTSLFCFTLVFSPISYAQKISINDNNGYNDNYFVIDGEAQDAFDEISNKYELTIDNQLFYTAIENGENFYIIGDRKINRFSDEEFEVSLQIPSFSPDIIYLKKYYNLSSSNYFPIKEAYVIHGIEQESYDFLDTDTITIDDNGTLFYVANTDSDKDIFISTDSQSKVPYAEIISVDVSPSGNFVYLAKKNEDDKERYIVFKTGKILTQGDVKNNEIIITNSGDIYYVAISENEEDDDENDDEKQYLVINNEIQKKYDSISHLHVFENRYYYIATENNKSFLVIDGVEQKKYNSIWYKNKGFTEDHYYYTVVKDDIMFVVKDGVEGEKFIAQNHPNSYYIKTINFNKETGELLYILQDNNHHVFLVRDENKQKIENLIDIEIAENGDVYALKKGENDKAIIEKNGEFFAEYDAIVDLRIIMGKIIYTAKKDGKWFVVRNEVEEKKYDNIGYVSTTNYNYTLHKREHYIYLANLGEFDVIVVDGKEDSLLHQNKNEYIEEALNIEDLYGDHIVYKVGIKSKNLCLLQGATQKEYYRLNEECRNHQKEIAYLVHNNIAHGYADNKFHNERKISRAEFLKIILLSQYSQDEIDESVKNSKQEFSDVSKQQWFFPYIQFASNNGIIKGYNDGTFKPNNEISFGESSKIITKILLDEDIKEESPEWWTQYILALNKHSQHLGKYGKRSHDYTITRGEMAEYVYWMKKGK